MRKMTEENLKNAYAGESQAHVKYLAFAEAAEQGRMAQAELARRAG